MTSRKALKNGKRRLEPPRRPHGTPQKPPTNKFRTEALRVPKPPTKRFAKSLTSLLVVLLVPDFCSGPCCFAVTAKKRTKINHEHPWQWITSKTILTLRK